MTVWILLVTMMSGRTIAAPFETEKECRETLKVVQKELRKDDKVKSVECTEGVLEQEEKKADEISI